MKAASGHNALHFGSLAILLGLVCGCTIGGKSAAIDSNSRMPYFGLELKERGPKAGSGLYRSIGRSSNDNTRIDVSFPIARVVGAESTKSRNSSTGIGASTDPNVGVMVSPVATRRRHDDALVPVIALPLAEVSRTRKSSERCGSTPDFQ